MAESSFFKKKYHVDMRDVDFNKEMKLSSLFSYFQDVAGLAVDELGIGINTLQSKFNVMWALIRIRVDIIQMPVWYEDITIETWPQSPKRLEFERDYIVRDMDGNIMVKAVSTWVIMDVDTRRLQPSKVIAIDYPPFKEERAIDCKLGKFKDFGHLELAYKKDIKYSDLDVNGHLNNAKYVDYITDCFSFDGHKKYIVKSCEVSYISEALPGDTITLYRDLSALESGLIYVEGKNKDNDSTFFKAQAEIVEKPSL